MKTIKIINIAVLAAVLFVGCGKESQNLSRLQLIAENMNHGNAKVWVNPGDVSGSASWVAGEGIDLGGDTYSIAYDEDEGFYLNTGDDELPATLYAIYPASTDAGGNSIAVVNNGAEASTIVISRLTVNFRNGGHDVVFPMATGAVDKDGGKLLFKHLTGGLKLTLTDTSSSRDYTVGSVKVVAYGDGAAPTAIEAHGVTTSWAVQGPVLPSGEVGEIEGNPSVAYASEMHFALTTDGRPGKAIPHGDRTTPASISFHVPVTISTVKTLVITGYSTEGSQLFVRSKTLDEAKAIQANCIYTIPEVMF